MGQEKTELRPLPSHAKKVFRGIIFSVWQWEQKLYDGSSKTFERIERADSVFVLPVLPDGRILMIIDEQPDREPILTLPAGRLEMGEPSEVAARRELLEETGYEAKKLLPWFSYQPSGKIMWNVHSFIGRDVFLKQPADPGVGEKITLAPHTFEEFITAVREHKTRDPNLKAYVLETLLDKGKMKEFKQLLYG